MKTNNTRNTKRCITRKKVFALRRTATVLFLLVATILAITVGSFKALFYGGRIVWTQVRMAQCYSTIKTLEKEHDYNLEMATQYPLGAKSYVEVAEKNDAEIEAWEKIRSDLHSSDDPVIAGAAKNGFDFPTLIIGLTVCLSVIAVYLVAFLFRSKLRVIFEIEVFAFVSIMSGVFYALRFILVRVVRLCSVEFNYHNNYRKKVLENLKADLQTKDATIPFKRKKKQKT